jgi:transposase
MVKHKEIFAEILRLKKIDFLENQFKNELHYTLKTQSFIHNEIDFIFKIANKHNKLLKEEKFSYMKDKIIEKNSEISETLNLYRSIIKKYNSLLQIKNYTIV